MLKKVDFLNTYCIKHIKITKSLKLYKILTKLKTKNHLSLQGYTFELEIVLTLPGCTFEREIVLTLPGCTFEREIVLTLPGCTFEREIVLTLPGYI
jgi:hypothetical protein